MPDSRTIVWIILIAFFVVEIIYMIIRRSANKKKIEDGEDKKKLKEAVVRVLPEAADYPVLYAHYEKTTQVNPRRSVTHYYYYGLTYQDDSFWVIPLTFMKDGTIAASEPDRFTKDILGDLFVNVTRKKDLVSSFTFVMRDKEGENPAVIRVDAINYKSDSYHHVNIAQQPECEKFCDFISALAPQVKEENPELQQAGAKTEKRIRLLGILGIVFSVIPLLGIIIGGIGLILAPKPSETGGKPTVGFILTLIAMILGVLLPIILLSL
ncbi:MAG: hypothetical protein NC517_07145 [Firmicutes bacterium]|nr:hypothetical protein [Bacillota bacterium]